MNVFCIWVVYLVFSGMYLVFSDMYLVFGVVYLGQFYSTPPYILLGGISVGWPLWT